MMIQTDKAIMRCNGRFYWAIATIGFVAASTTAFGALTQEEVDRIVDNEIIMCEHEEDADAIEICEGQTPRNARFTGLSANSTL